MKTKTTTITLIIALAIIAGFGTVSASAISDYEMHKYVCEESIKKLNDIPLTTAHSSHIKNEAQTAIALGNLDAFLRFVKFNEEELVDAGVDTEKTCNWILGNIAECEIRLNRLEVLNTFGTDNYNSANKIDLTLLPIHYQPTPVGAQCDIPIVCIVTGGTQPYKYSLGSFMSGTPPPGTTIDMFTGNLIGIPTTPGTYTFEVCASGFDGRTSCKEATVTIEEKEESKPSFFTSLITLVLNLFGIGDEGDLIIENIPVISEIPDASKTTSMYDGIYAGTFNYEYADYVQGEDYPWIPGSFDLQVTLKTTIITPSMTVSGITMDGFILMEVTDVWCSDPGFGTGSTDVTPIYPSGANLPTDPTKAPSMTNMNAITITFPNGAAIAAPDIGIDMYVSPDGKTLSNKPYEGHDTWITHSATSGTLSSSESVTTRAIGVFEGTRLYKLTTWSLTKI